VYLVENAGCDPDYPVGVWGDVSTGCPDGLPIRLHPSFSNEAVVRGNMFDISVIFRRTSDKDEGSEFVFCAGVGDLYHLKEQGSREAAGLRLDLGSNLGTVTIQLSRLHPQWTIVVVETMPITFMYEVVNLWLNVRHEMQWQYDLTTSTAQTGCGIQTGTFYFFYLKKKEKHRKHTLFPFGLRLFLFRCKIN
jgi:hypothetical protein